MKSKIARFSLSVLTVGLATGFHSVGSSESAVSKIDVQTTEVIVAVIDTGADVNHPDLRSHLWSNPGESGLDASHRDKASNGIDDDANGYVDDVHGWNFTTSDHNLSDRLGHGTHIAGIVHGSAPGAKLMILKYYDSQISGHKAIMNTADAIRYATKMGAKIINYSAGGLQPNAHEKAAIEEAERKGVLVVAAAGNEKSNSDDMPYYPAGYELSNILSVTAIDHRRAVLPSSNYGQRSVDIAAPGFEVTSTLPGGSYGRMTGTSQATAFVSGAAAQVVLNSVDGLMLSPQSLIDQLARSGEVERQLMSKTKYQTVLNSQRALAMQDMGVLANGMRMINDSGVDQELVMFGAKEVPAESLPRFPSSEE